MNKKSGIYKITNLINGKLYIGKSVNVKERKTTHLRDLRNNKHHNQHLQNAVNKYGLTNFTFDIIEYCNEEDLFIRENYWITELRTYESEIGYNISIPMNDERLRKNTTKNFSINAYYDKDELISYLQEFYYMEGKVPTQRELGGGSNYPCNNVYIDRFGSFKNALIEADLYDFVENKKLFERFEYTKDDVYEKFKKFVDNYGKFPNHIELKETNKFDLPTHNIVIKHYGSIENLKKEFGFDKESVKEKENEIALIQLKELYIKDGYVTSRTIDKSKLTRSTGFYLDRFGSLMNAYELIGIYTKEHVTEILKEFVKIHNRIPNNKDIINYKLPSKNIIAQYYSSEELNDLLGFTKEKENREALISLKQLYDSQGFVSEETINKSEITKSAKFYCVRFGNLTNACKEANIPLDGLILKYKAS